MDRAKLLEDNSRALRAAGLIQASNTGVLETHTLPPSADLAKLAQSSDPRTAEAARREIARIEALPLEEVEGYELPEETPHLNDQSPEQRQKNATDLTQDVKCSYDD